MNKEKGIYHKRKIAILRLLLVVLLLCGCTKEQINLDSVKDDVNDDVTDTMDREEQKILTIEEIQELYPEKKVLVWVYNDFLVVSARVNEAVNAELANKGYDFVLFFEQVKEISYESEINRRISEGKAPDIISAGIGESGTRQGTLRAVENNWMENLEDYLDGEQGSALKKAFPMNVFKSFQVNGELYGVTGILPFSTDYVYYVNMDIVEKYGISLEDLAKREPDDLEEILDRVYQGENSIDFITYVDNENSVIDYYTAVHDAYNNMCSAVVTNNRNSESKVVNLFTEPTAVSYFTKLAEYKAKGYLAPYDKINKTPNFFIIQGADDLFGINGTETIDMIESQYVESGEIAVVKYKPTFLTTQANSISGICSQSDKKDMAFQALSAVFTDKDISDLLLYGIEGEQYSIKDGKVQLNNGSLFVWYISMYFGNPLISTPTTEEPLNKAEIATEKINEMMAPDTLGVYLELNDLMDSINQINEIVTEYTGLYHGEYEDVANTLEELNAKLETAGIQNVIDEINRQYQAKSKKK